MYSCPMGDDINVMLQGTTWNKALEINLGYSGSTDITDGKYWSSNLVVHPRHVNVQFEFPMQYLSCPYNTSAYSNL